MTSAERQRLKAARVADAPTRNVDGSYSLFFQGGGNAPSEADQNSRTQWGKNVEANTDSQFHHCGSQLDKALD